MNDRLFSSNQGGARKDVERLFVMIQGRFHILIPEIRSWELNKSVLIVNTCVILHNLIVRMQQNKYFRDEADGLNLITEFLKNDDQTTMEAAIKYNEYNGRRIKEVLKWIGKRNSYDGY